MVSRPGAILQYVRERGGDSDALIRRFDLPRTSETDREVHLRLSTMYAFQDAAAA